MVVIMLAKMTSKNQLTLPKIVVQAVGASEYFDVEVREGQIVLTPVRIQRGDAVRGKLAALSLNQADIANAIRWARLPSSTSVLSGSPANDSTERHAVRKPAARKKAARRG